MYRLLHHEVSAPSEARAREVAALGPWFHNLHLPDGTQTAPTHALGDFPAFKWRELAPHLPADLTGWTVLDLGCNAGYYCFELARRGAQVTGIDTEPLFLRQAEWAAREFGLEAQVAFRRQQVYDLARLPERYDLVLFMGLFYHLRYPLLALDLVAEKVRRLLVFQTLEMPGEEVDAETAVDRDVMDREAFRTPGWPKMAFIEHRFAGDPTNWWVPNHAGVEAMLRSTGLRVIAYPGHEMYLCEPHPDGPSWFRSHGLAELLSATGRPWQDEADRPRPKEPC
jgi:tRNA (mo5U34)-methyltransferase